MSSLFVLDDSDSDGWGQGQLCVFVLYVELTPMENNTNSTQPSTRPEIESGTEVDTAVNAPEKKENISFEYKCLILNGVPFFKVP